jgi:hypothetical protein
MKKVFLFIALTLTYPMLRDAFCGEAKIKEGLWEIVTEVAVSNAPYQMPPQKFTECIKDKGASIPKSIFRESNNQDCKVEERVQGDTVYFKIVCKEGNEVVTNEGHMTYKGDSFEGSSKATSTGEDKVEVTHKIRGKWIGECQK